MKRLTPLCLRLCLSPLLEAPDPFQVRVVCKLKLLEQFYFVLLGKRWNSFQARYLKLCPALIL